MKDRSPHRTVDPRGAPRPSDIVDTTQVRGTWAAPETHDLTSWDDEPQPQTPPPPPAVKRTIRPVTPTGVEHSADARRFDVLAWRPERPAPSPSRSRRPPVWSLATVLLGFVLVASALWLRWNGDELPAKDLEVAERGLAAVEAPSQAPDVPPWRLDVLEGLEMVAAVPTASMEGEATADRSEAKVGETPTKEGTVRPEPEPAPAPETEPAPAPEPADQSEAKVGETPTEEGTVPPEPAPVPQPQAPPDEPEVVADAASEEGSEVIAQATVPTDGDDAAAGGTADGDAVAPRDLQGLWTGQVRGRDVFLQVLGHDDANIVATAEVRQPDGWVRLRLEGRLEGDRLRLADAQAGSVLRGEIGEHSLRGELILERGGAPLALRVQRR